MSGWDGNNDQNASNTAANIAGQLGLPHYSQTAGEQAAYNSGKGFRDYLDGITPKTNGGGGAGGVGASSARRSRLSRLRTAACWLFLLVALESSLPARDLVAAAIGAGPPLSSIAPNGAIGSVLALLLMVSADFAAAPYSGRRVNGILVAVIVITYGMSLLQTAGWLLNQILTGGFADFGISTFWFLGWQTIHILALLIAIRLALGSAAPEPAPASTSQKLGWRLKIGPLANSLTKFPFALIAWLGLWASSATLSGGTFTSSLVSFTSTMIWAASFGLTAVVMSRWQQINA